MKTAATKLKFKLIFIFYFSLFVFHFSLTHAQVPTVQDCLGAIRICQEVYIEENSYSGDGNYHYEIYEHLPCNTACPGSCLAGETNSVWYTWTVQESGVLRFVIDPVVATDDYDWAVYDLTELSCSDIYSDYSLMQKSCNAYGSGNNGNTGISTANGGTTDCNNCGTTNIWNADLWVYEGETYVLVVENWNGTTQGFTLDFSASTASISDNSPPGLDTVITEGTICGSMEIMVGFSENVVCESVDAADFLFTGPGGPFTILDVQGETCMTGGELEKMYTLLLDRPFMTNGEYSLILLPGNEVYDGCDNIAMADTLAISLDLGAPVVIDTGIVITPANEGMNNGHITGLVVNGNEPLSYRWYDHYNDTIGTGLELHDVFTGNYFLEITDTNACKTKAGPYFVDLVEDIAEVLTSHTGISVFPNPNSGRFTVSSNEDIVSISIFNMTGNNLYSFEKEDITASTLHSDLTRNGAGIYLVKVTLENGMIVTRFVQVL